MVLELHVWGPAFNLPSIEAQCLATIAYFSLAVPRDEWVLIASSDPSISPTNELPALRHGTTWVSRFRNIVDYIRQFSNGEWNLDSVIDNTEKPDHIAFSCFVEARGQPLVDLSLYVCSQNYWAATSPAYGAILQWPNQWILPPKLRSSAKSRIEHLGLTSLDLEAMQQQLERDRQPNAGAGRIPTQFIRKPRDTVSSLLGKTSQGNQFKLEALTAEFFEPMEEQLGGGKRYLLTDEQATSLDCLAVAYLSLALVTELPEAWLRESMRRKAPKLVDYTERMRRRCFGAVVEVSHAFDDRQGSGSGSLPLPWRVPERVSLAKIGSMLASSVADNVPILKDLRMNNRLREAVEASATEFSESERSALSIHAENTRKDMYLSIATAVAAVVAFIGYISFTQYVQVREEEEDEGGEGEPDAQMNLISLPNMIGTQTM